MGGRGSNGSVNPVASPTVPPAPPAPPTPQQPQARQPQPPQPPQPPQQANQIQNQVPDSNNTPVVPDPISQLQAMNDQQLEQIVKASKNANMPNHLADHNDITQKFVFTIGLNAKPMVLDAKNFKQFMTDNNIPSGQILSRSVNGGSLNTTAGGQRKLTAQDITDMMMYSSFNYVGGKIGGQAIGAGTYFDMNGGRNTGYGTGKTVNAVLNPKTAKVITDSKLATLAQKFDRTHPRFKKATGGYSTSFHNNNKSVYALVLGYNVITDGSGYYNAIDRSALVYLE